MWHDEDVLEIHPHDAEQRGIKDGDWVGVASRAGETVLRAVRHASACSRAWSTRRSTFRIRRQRRHDRQLGLGDELPRVQGHGGAGAQGPAAVRVAAELREVHRGAARSPEPRALARDRRLTSTRWTSRSSSRWRIKSPRTATMGPDKDKVAAVVADHLTRFWTPAMRVAIIEGQPRSSSSCRPSPRAPSRSSSCRRAASNPPQ